MHILRYTHVFNMEKKFAQDKRLLKWSKMTKKIQIVKCTKSREENTECEARIEIKELFGCLFVAQFFYLFFW